MTLKVDFDLCAPEGRRCTLVKGAVVDTGADQSVVPFDNVRGALSVPTEPHGEAFTGVNGDKVPGSVLPAKIALRTAKRRGRLVDVKVAVVPKSAGVTEALLGIDFLRAAGCVVDLRNERVRCRRPRAARVAASSPAAVPQREGVKESK